jgi:hypothetical protein
VVVVNQSRIVGGVAAARVRPKPSSSTARRNTAMGDGMGGGNAGGRAAAPRSHPGARGGGYGGGRRHPREPSPPPRKRPDPRPWRKPPEVGLYKLRMQPTHNSKTPG